MRTLVPLEIVTALVYGYLGLSLSWTNAVSIVRGLHFAIVVIAAIVISWGAWRRAQWTPKLAIGLAAFAGIPNLTTLAALLQLILRAGPAVRLSFTLVLVAALCQLTILLACLRRLRLDAAAF